LSAARKSECWLPDPPGRRTAILYALAVTGRVRQRFRETGVSSAGNAGPNQREIGEKRRILRTIDRWNPQLVTRLLGRQALLDGKTRLLAPEREEETLGGHFQLLIERPNMMTAIHLTGRRRVEAKFGVRLLGAELGSVHADPCRGPVRRQSSPATPIESPGLASEAPGHRAYPGRIEAAGLEVRHVHGWPWPSSSEACSSQRSCPHPLSSYSSSRGSATTDGIIKQVLEKTHKLYRQPRGMVERDRWNSQVR